MIKNNSDVVAISKYHVLIAEASRLSMVCFSNGLGLNIGYGVEKDLPYLEFKVYAGPESIILYSGKIFGREHDLMDAIVDSITGKMISEVSPPAQTILDGQKIVYWKRELINRVDATRLGASRPETSKVQTQINWVGFDANHKEVVRMYDGATNPGYELVARVEYVDLGPLGVVVAVVPKNLIKDETYPPSIGESIWMKEKKEHDDAAEMAAIDAMALRSNQVAALETKAIAALVSQDVAVLNTSNVAELTFSKICDLKQVRAPGIQKWIDDGLNETDAERIYSVSDRDFGVNIDVVLPIEERITVETLRGTKSSVTFIIPKIPTRESFDCLSTPGQAIFMIDFVEGYRQLVQDETLKPQAPEVHERFCKFLREFLESDIHQTQWAEHVMAAETQIQLAQMSTRTTFSAAIHEFSSEVMREIFGIGDVSSQATIIEIPSEISIIALSKLLVVPQQFVIDYLRKANYIIHPDQGLDFRVAALVASAIGWNAVEESDDDGKVASVE